MKCVECHVEIGQRLREKRGLHATLVKNPADGQECAKCHSPNGWRVWEFDHKETGFPLEGAHAKLACAGCHKQPAEEVKLNPNCLSCHEQDDVHLGQYGRQCQRCHSTVTFKGARLH